MKAGRELDALVAEKVMGCKLVWPPRFDEPGISQSEYERRRRLSRVPRCGCADREHMFIPDEGGYSGWLMDYSTDIRAAWEVLEVLLSKSQQLVINGKSTAKLEGHPGHVRAWYVTVLNSPSGPFQVSVLGNQLPLAICLAALKAVGVNTDYCSG